MDFNLKVLKRLYDWWDFKALKRLYDWWDDHGNPEISVFINEDVLVFYDDSQEKRAAHIMRLGDGDCFLILDYGLMDDPFTAQERRQIAKFVRDNNEKFYD